MKFLIAIVLWLTAISAIPADQYSTININGAAQVVANTSPVITNNIAEPWPPLRPYVDTAGLFNTDGYVIAAWTANVAVGDSVQVFYSFASSAGPWTPGSDSTILTDIENEFLLWCFFSEPYAEPYTPIWVFVRGCRNNGDVAYSRVALTYIQP